MLVIYLWWLCIYGGYVFMLVMYLCWLCIYVGYVFMIFIKR